MILIVKEDKKKEIKKVFEMKYDWFTFEVSIKALIQCIELSLRDMVFTQYLSNSKEYGKILYSKIDNNIINNDEKKKK